MKSNFSTIVVLSLASLIPGLIAGAPVMAQQPAPYRLTLQDAIRKALQANLSVLVGATRVDEAEGARMRRMSAALLPRINAQTYANVQNRDLSAFGISAPGFPKVVGPFSNYDFRVYAQQNIIDLASYRTLKASEKAVDAGKMDLQDARDLIVRAIAGLYLNAQSAAARAESAQSRVTDSTTLYKLAKDKHPTMVHIGFEDASYPFSVPGTKSDVKGYVTGMAFITSDGQQTPRISCHKFQSVSFQDLRSKSKVSVSRFAADEVNEGEVADNPATKK